MSVAKTPYLGIDRNDRPIDLRSRECSNHPVRKSQVGNAETTGGRTMSCDIRVLRIGLVSLALVGVSSGVTRASAQSVTSEETVRSVTRMLERLPYYGVFD